VVICIPGVLGGDFGGLGVGLPLAIDLGLAGGLDLAENGTGPVVPAALAMAGLVPGLPMGVSVVPSSVDSMNSYLGCKFKTCDT